MTISSPEEDRLWLHNQLNGAIAFIALTLLFVTLRVGGVGLLERHKKNSKPFEWDTALLLLSFVAFLPLCVSAIVAAQGYLASYNVKTRTEFNTLYTFTYKASYAFSVAYPIACVLPKISICFMYLDLFKVGQLLRLATKMTMAFLCVNAIAWLLPTIAVCQPIAAYWTPNPQQPRCINYNVFGTWIVLPHIITDIVILILPQFMLWNMRLELGKKIGVAITFFAGSIGIMGGCLRLALYIQRTYEDRPGTHQTEKSIAIDFIVSFVEAGMYLIAACLPRLRPLISWFYGGISLWFSSLRKRRQSAGDAPSVMDLPLHESPLGEDEKLGKAGLISIKLTGFKNLQSLK